jgi:hypothetical protein
VHSGSPGTLGVTLRTIHFLSGPHFPLSLSPGHLVLLYQRHCLAMTYCSQYNTIASAFSANSDYSGISGDLFYVAIARTAIVLVVSALHDCSLRNNKTWLPCIETKDRCLFCLPRSPCSIYQYNSEHMYLSLRDLGLTPQSQLQLQSTTFYLLSTLPHVSETQFSSLTL